MLQYNIKYFYCLVTHLWHIDTLLGNDNGHLLGNSFVNTQQFWIRCKAAACGQQWKYYWKRCFL